jgi:hypothetical protein
MSNNIDEPMTYIPDPLTRRRKIDCKPELIISSLQRFYSTNPDISKVIPYFLGTSALSLRIIDWFVTKYCRKNFTHYTLNGKDFIVYRSYKGQLKAYSKQYFDPNCRRERIMFKVPGFEPFTTTIGQLNFFRWALESSVLKYIEEHEETIRKEYNSFLKESIALQKKEKSQTKNSHTSTVSSLSTESNMSNSVISIDMVRTTRRKRTKQTPSALRQLQISSNPIQLEFN